MPAAITLLEGLPGIAPEHRFQACEERHTAVAVLLPFALHLPWEADATRLLALFRTDGSGDWASISLMPDTASLRAALAGLHTAAALEAWLVQQGIGWFPAGQPVLLQPVHIPKPWGEEIWFTGIEPRGVSCAMPVSGQPVPLPWLLAALPHYLQGPQAGQDPVLLKILAPWPDEALGDLYLELHEQKREVYIITGVDRRAWPDGQGAIRFGVDPAARAAYASDEAFREAFAAAAEAYEAHRREVDAWLDDRRAAAGLDPAVPADPAWMRDCLAGLPEALRVREQQLKDRLDAFTRLRPLRPGDVVQVPLRVPHSLQHGVRAVEFQTPVYERKILAFGQKVLTQAHWDSRAGAALMRLDTPPEPVLQRLAGGEGVLREEVTRFEDFAVERVRLAAGACHRAAAGGSRLLMAVDGVLVAGQARLAPEQAWFWPAALPLAAGALQTAENTVFLVAIPSTSG